MKTLFLGQAIAHPTIAHERGVVLKSDDAQEGITLTILAGCTVKITDDSFNDARATGPLTFVIEKDAKLFYDMSTVDDPRYDEAITSCDELYDAIDKKLTFRFVGPGASADIRCICYGKGKRVISLRTMQHHVAPNTKSNLLIKGVFDGQAKLIANNLIRIEEGAQQVDAREMNKNLLLSDQARVITIPKLEVHADDVSAQHGASISRLSADELFYCQSRGMSQAQASTFLIKSFLS